MNTPYVFKRCTKCGEYKVANNTYFSKDKRNKYGLNCWCKECDRQYRKANKDKFKEYHKEYDKKYRQANKDKIKEYQQEYRKDNKEYFKKYEQANKDKRREYFKAYGKEYRKTPQGQVAYFNGHCKRRAREQSQGRGITKEQWLEMMNYFNWQCAYSGIRISKQEDRSIDHIVPVDKGGEHEIWNVVPMYLPYNKRKNASDMLDWYKEQDFYDEDRLAKIYEWQAYAFNKYRVVEELI